MTMLRARDLTVSASLDGETVYRGTATGALAEKVVVAERVALPLGEDVPLEEAALLGCAALTGIGAVLFAARVQPNSSVVVIGAGGVGQFVLQGVGPQLDVGQTIGRNKTLKGEELLAQLRAHRRFVIAGLIEGVRQAREVDRPEVGFQVSGRPRQTDGRWTNPLTSCRRMSGIWSPNLSR